MKYILRFTLILFLVGFGFSAAKAHINPKQDGENRQGNRLEHREACDPAVDQTDQAINNVRARLLTGGDVWWDGSNGRYVVPKVPAGQPEVSSIFAGAVWLGGVDPAGNLKVAAQTYGRSGGRSDFWTGPIDPILGTTDSEVCEVWDRFFKVTGEEIDEHVRNYDASINEGKAYSSGDIPRNIRGWPARGNDFFFDVHGFELPNTSQGLAGFFDRDGDEKYDPDLGDYPIIEVRGCDAPQYPDEMTFWIYNDAGNIHSQSQGDPIQMEIQVQAFAYATNDEINDMTFQRYKLINRAIESIDSMFFAVWIDPDLGCHTDDYVGCDTLRSLAFVYNADAVDGETGCNCGQGVNTYCDEIPILGIDYFRGPLNENLEEIGMSSFTYFNNSTGNPPPGTTDPNNAAEYYNYLSGSWRDGTPFTFGDDAYQDGEPIKYAFGGDPSKGDEWSMCAERTDPTLDRRTLQATGPFRLDPGAVNELIIGVVWVADQLYPCPSLRELRNADDIAQALFDNCFEITDGPDAPDVDFIELDQEIIAVFTNDILTSNNAFEQYAQPGLRIPSTVEDTLYQFEGYKMFQLSGPDVTLADLDDPNKSRLVFQSDIKNGVDKVFNWEEVESPLENEAYFAPVPKVEGSDNGVRHTLKIVEDQFAAGDDRRLVNHKKYYFTMLAYAYNNYQDYDSNSGIGQKELYLEGRKNIGDGTNPFYTAIPRPITYTKLNAEYGTGVSITRLDGIGAGANFLDMSDATRNAIIDGDFDGTITYEEGRGPIEVNIFNPLEVKDGEFILTFLDSDLSDEDLETDARWTLTDVSKGITVASETTIERLNEQILGEYGFSVTIGQTDDAGSNIDATNGGIGVELEYAEGSDNNWFLSIPDGTRFNGLRQEFDNILNFVSTDSGETDEVLDPEKGLTDVGNGWIPYMLADWRARTNDAFGLGYLSPAWTQSVGGNGGALVRNSSELANLNNVDVIFTSDKSKWSRCVVVQSGNQYYDAQGLRREDANNYFDLRSAPSVGKDTNADGTPKADGDGMGMGWFPGYAIDVETGQRLNIFFGENSFYDEDQAALAESTAVGNDMMWNPSREFLYPSAGQTPDLSGFILGGQHYIYVTKQAYDGCEAIRGRLEPSPSSFRKLVAVKEITWTCLPLANGITSYEEGLIPSDLVVKLRVDNPYQVAEGTGEYAGYPTYKFNLEGFAPEEVTKDSADPALDMINVAPNPYYGYSSYETSQFSNIVKVTNLPAECVVTIYSLDGKFIRQYDRNELGALPEGANRAIQRAQINPDLEWDLKNSKGIPIASGVYLIHINAPELGERVIKWFGVARQFDPSGL